MIFPIPVTEPQRGEGMLIFLNTLSGTYEITRSMVPVLADIFVFTYPIFLLCLYWYGIRKDRSEEKLGALMVFGSAIFATVVNIIIQASTEKQRPEMYITNKENLVLSHLPTDPFPSDHAAVSAAIAMAVLLRARKTNNKLLYGISIFFWCACIIMSVARVTVAVHRPTDVIVGIIVGAWCAWILLSDPVFVIYKKRIAQPLISLEKYVVSRVRKRS